MEFLWNFPNFDQIAYLRFVAFRKCFGYEDSIFVFSKASGNDMSVLCLSYLFAQFHCCVLNQSDRMSLVVVFACIFGCCGVFPVLVKSMQFFYHSSIRSHRGVRSIQTLRQTLRLRWGCDVFGLQLVARLIVSSVGCGCLIVCSIGCHCFSLDFLKMRGWR